MTGIGSLILTNVRRNLARSMLAVVGMGIAALVMTSSLTLSQGYPAAAFAPYRNYSGGDILVFAEPWWVRGADVNRAAAGSWAFKLAGPELPGPWQMFLPHLTTRGAIVPARQQRGFFCDEQVERLSAALSGIDGVAEIRPYFAIPCTSAYFTLTRPGEDPAAAPPTGPRSGWSDVYLRAWRGGDWDALDQYVTAGRPLDQEDAGRLVCLVDTDRAKLAQLAPDRFPPDVPAVGGTLTVVLPRLRRTVTEGGEGGQMHSLSMNYLDPLVVELEVAGHYSVPSRIATWDESSAAEPDPDLHPDPAEQHPAEQLYLTSPEIIVPWATAVDLISQMSDGALDTWVTALALEVDSLARVEAIVNDVVAQRPGLSPVSVPRLAGLANARWLPEPMYDVPQEEWQGAAPAAQQGEPVQISGTFNLIFFAVAALLAAANGIILVLERQREIGILKAVGVYSRDVILMILGEVVVLSAIGAVSGFILAESLAIWNLISNRTALSQILLSVGSDFVKVLGLTVALATLFGLFPALRTIRMTAIEVLRRE